MASSDGKVAPAAKPGATGVVQQSGRMARGNGQGQRLWQRAEYLHLIIVIDVYIILYYIYYILLYIYIYIIYTVCVILYIIYIIYYIS